jgi:hypothetical protein
MDVDTLFNTSLNNYLRIFDISFPLQKIIEKGNNTYGITTDIRISCNRKKRFYLLSRDSNDINLKSNINNTAKYCQVWLKKLKG